MSNLGHFGSVKPASCDVISTFDASRQTWPPGNPPTPRTLKWENMEGLIGNSQKTMENHL